MAKKEKDVKKKKDKGTKEVKVSKRGGAKRLSRTDKIAKRMRNISAKSSVKVSGAKFLVETFHRQPVELHGYIIEQGTDYVIFRHKKTNASKRMVLTRFANKDIIELFGKPGELAALTVLRDVKIRELEGKISNEKNGIVVVTTPSGETVTLFPNEHVTVVISLDEDKASGGSSKKDKAEGKGKKKGKGKPKDLDDDEEDDDDDLDE